MQSHSCAKSAVTTAVMAIAILAVSTVVGVAYALGAWYSPWFVLNGALTVGAGWLIGWAVARAAIRRVVMSRVLIVLSAALAGILALYVAWSVNAMLRVRDVGLRALDPRFLAAYLEVIRDTDVVAIEDDQRRTKIQGSGLVALWIGEAAVLLVAAAVAANKHSQQAGPVCEACRTRKVERFGILRYQPAEDIHQFAADLCAGRVECLEGLTLASVEDDLHMRIDIVWCPSCHQDCSTSVALINFFAEPAETYIRRREPLPMPMLARLLEIAKESEDAVTESATVA